MSGSGRRALALVTDSTAGLGADVAAAAGIEVVPLHVLVGDPGDPPGRPERWADRRGERRGEPGHTGYVEYVEGVDVDREVVAAALHRRRRVRTSRPSPLAFLTAYERLAQEGATHIVSAHLSAELSGTCEAARLAARDAPVPVRVVDSRSIALALGHAVLDGATLADALAAAGDVDEAAVEAVAARIEERARAAQVLVYVHSLEHLRRGGRIGAAAGLLGGALAIKPLLALVDGHLEPVEKLRTASRALSRLVELTVHTIRVAPEGARVAVQHVDAAARAQKVAADLTAALPDRADVVVEVAEVTAVVAVHLGPGTVATIVSTPPGAAPAPPSTRSAPSTP